MAVEQLQEQELLSKEMVDDANLASSDSGEKLKDIYESEEKEEAKTGESSTDPMTMDPSYAKKEALKMKKFSTEVHASTGMYVDDNVSRAVINLPEAKREMFKKQLDLSTPEGRENVVSFFDAFLNAYNWVAKKYSKLLKKTSDADDKTLENEVCDLAKEQKMVIDSNVSHSFVELTKTSVDVIKEKDFKITPKNRGAVQGFISEYLINDIYHLENPEVVELSLQTVTNARNSNKLFIPRERERPSF